MLRRVMHTRSPPATPIAGTFLQAFSREQNSYLRAWARHHANNGPNSAEYILQFLNFEKELAFNLAINRVPLMAAITTSADDTLVLSGQGDRATLKHS